MEEEWNAEENRKREKRFTAVRKLTDNRFLNLYEMDALDRKGQPFSYYFASRNREENLPLKTGKIPKNGIVIYAICRQNPGRLVMIRQYRYPLNAELYELPAGLIDEGETPQQAAVREMREETGLTFLPCEEIDPAFEGPYFLGAGLTDETSTTVFGYADGEISKRYQESTEQIEVLFAGKAEAKEILHTQRVSLRAAFLLVQFLQQDDTDPFRAFRLHMKQGTDV